MSQAELDALIVANIADLDAAAYHLQHRVQIDVGEALSLVAEKQLGQLGWDGLADYNGEGIWVAPKDWLKPAESSGDDFKCQFSLEEGDSTDGEADYFWLTQLVGLGRAQLGFQWARNDVSKARWRKAVGQNDDLIAKIRGLGFAYQEKEGCFFLPVVIDPTQLSAALAEESPEQALQQPLADAFAVLDRSKTLFDSLLEKAVID